MPPGPPMTTRSATTATMTMCWSRCAALPRPSSRLRLSCRLSAELEVPARAQIFSRLSTAAPKPDMQQQREADAAERKRAREEEEAKLEQEIQAETMLEIAEEQRLREAGGQPKIMSNDDYRSQRRLARDAWELEQPVEVLGGGACRRALLRWPVLCSKQ